MAKGGCLVGESGLLTAYRRWGKVALKLRGEEHGDADYYL